MIGDHLPLKPTFKSHHCPLSIWQCFLQYFNQLHQQLDLIDAMPSRALSNLSQVVEHCSNNEVKYEVLIVGLKIMKKLGAKKFMFMATPSW